MTACSDQILHLNGLLDGELDAVNTLAVEEHLKTCSACAEAFHQLRSSRDAVRGPGVAQEAPAALRSRIEASLDRLSAPDTPPPRRQRLRSSAWAAGSALGAGAALAAGLAAFVILPELALTDVDRQLVGSHVRSLLGDHLIDIRTSDQHVVRPWFNGKVDIAPPVPELADAGFPLVGGRLDYVKGRVVPALVYRRRLHTVNLFVWPDAKAGGGERTARRDGYSLVEWSQGGLRFSAVSDVDIGDLKLFQRVFAGRAPK